MLVFSAQLETCGLVLLISSGALKLLLDTHQSEVFGSESGSFTITINEARQEAGIGANAIHCTFFQLRKKGGLL